jgi:hypothetical protein
MEIPEGHLYSGSRTLFNFYSQVFMQVGGKTMYWVEEEDMEKALLVGRIVRFNFVLYVNLQGLSSVAA